MDVMYITKVETLRLGQKYQTVFCALVLIEVCSEFPHSSICLNNGVILIADINPAYFRSRAIYL